jgi:hypothetical protein
MDDTNHTDSSSPRCVVCGEHRSGAGIGFRFFRRGRLSVCDGCWRPGLRATPDDKGPIITRHV